MDKYKEFITMMYKKKIITKEVYDKALKKNNNRSKKS